MYVLYVEHSSELVYVVLSGVETECLVEFLLFLFFRVPIWVVIPIWICFEYRRGLDLYMLMCVTV